MTIRMLIEGHADPVSAKRLGVSPRTYAGYVADLKEEYEAETRFQLGYTMGPARRLGPRASTRRDSGQGPDPDSDRHANSTRAVTWVTALARLRRAGGMALGPRRVRGGSVPVSSLRVVSGNVLGAQRLSADCGRRSPSWCRWPRPGSREDRWPSPQPPRRWRPS